MEKLTQEIFEEKIAKDEAMLKKIESSKTSEELTKVFNDAGYEVDRDNIDNAVAFLNGDRELPEEALDNVSGGFLGAALVISCAIYAGCLAAGIGGAVFSYTQEKKAKKKK